MLCLVDRGEGAADGLRGARPRARVPVHAPPHLPVRREPLRGAQSRREAHAPEPRHHPPGSADGTARARGAPLGARALAYASSIAPRAASRRPARARHPAGRSVALLVPNVPEFTIAYFGILYAGCTVVPLNVLLSAPEVAYHLEGLERAAADRASALRGAGAAPAPRRPACRWSRAAAGRGALAELAAADADRGAPPDARRRHRGDPLHLGDHRASPRAPSSRTRTCSSTARSSCRSSCRRADDDVALGVLPLFHSFGQTCIQNATIARGGTFTLLPRFDAGGGASRPWSATA